MSLTDDELVARSRTGDRDAYCLLLERHRVVALRVGYAIAGDDAEDAVQDAMIKAYRHLPRFRDGAPFRPWLLAIVANESRNRLRSRSRQTAVSLRLGAQPNPSRAPSAEAVALDHDRAETVLAAVAALDARDREVVALRYFAGLTEAEMAAALGCAPGTVKSRLHRALARLRERLAGEESTASSSRREELYE